MKLKIHKKKDQQQSVPLPVPAGAQPLLDHIQRFTQQMDNYVASQQQMANEAEPEPLNALQVVRRHSEVPPSFGSPALETIEEIEEEDEDEEEKTKEQDHVEIEGSSACFMRAGGSSVSFSSSSSSSSSASVVSKDSLDCSDDNDSVSAASSDLSGSFAANHADDYYLNMEGVVSTRSLPTTLAWTDVSSLTESSDDGDEAHCTGLCHFFGRRLRAFLFR